MNKQEIEKAICVMENLKYLLIDVLGNKNNEKELDMAISALEQQLTNGWIPEIMKEVLGEEATNLILSSPEEFKKWLERGIWNCKRLNELATDNNVVTKSGKDNNTKDADLSPEEAQELKAERDYWEREAKKWCAKLGEIRLWIGEQNKKCSSMAYSAKAI